MNTAIAFAIATAFVASVLILAGLTGWIACLLVNRLNGNVQHRHDDASYMLYLREHYGVMHTHDHEYSLVGHDHHADYAHPDHEHDDKYAQINHGHTQYATRAELLGYIGVLVQ